MTNLESLKFAVRPLCLLRCMFSRLRTGRLEPIESIRNQAEKQNITIQNSLHPNLTAWEDRMVAGMFQA